MAKAQGLAESFNEMTRELRQQFAALETLSEVDRLLLESPAIEDVLDTLPAAYDRPLYAQKCSDLFEHVFESYPERDAGVYAVAV